jgi:SlyX protein
MTIEEQLIDIETKIAFQEDTLQELNELVYQQQKQLDQLEAAFKSLASRIKELSETIPVAEHGDEKPPHY